MEDGPSRNTRSATGRKSSIKDVKVSGFSPKKLYFSDGYKEVRQKRKHKKKQKAQKEVKEAQTKKKDIRTFFPTRIEHNGEQAVT